MKMWRVVPPLALATTLHAMVLTGVVQWHGSDAGGRDTRASAASLPVPVGMSVRVAQAAAAAPARAVLAPSTEPTAEATEPPPPAAPVTATVTAATPPAETTAQATQAAPLEPVPIGPSPIAEPMPPLAAATPVDDASIAVAPPAEVGGAPDRYHARRELSRPPKALSPIDIVFPPGVPTPGRHAAVLAVYIDELGQVRKVRTQGEALPLAFEDAARNAFLSARFRAGELEGRNVKSFILVEVVFDEQAESRGLSVSALGRTTR